MMRFSFIVPFLVICSVEHASSQNAYFRLGQQAYIDGNFKTAVTRLEKGCLIDSTNATALWMLGYSYYHNENFAKSIIAFTKELAITPGDADAYYYRARAKVHIGKDSMNPAEKEKYLLDAIRDFTRALTINPNDDKVYQNRGLVYRDYAMFKLQPTKFYDKTRAIQAFKQSVADLQKVLDSNPSRSDITSQIDLSKEKMATVVGHH